MRLMISTAMSSNGKQRAYTYTIGFGLSKMATNC